MVVFGPVPSRRLGRSLGINNIPAKSCSYSCVYCQLGLTRGKTIKRTSFYDPKEILEAARRQLASVASDDGPVDYVTFVPDGEPSLDINLRTEISLLRDLGIPIAIISNASLIWDEEVRQAFMEADLVSLKVDAVSEDIWKRVDRPHGRLELERILEGIVQFAGEFSGDLITETMLLSGIDYEEEIGRIADFLSQIPLKEAYLAVPTRPPCEEWVEPADEDLLNRAFQEYASTLGGDRVELLIGYEGDAFS
ncbi:radical SAM protein, partial [Candidatus Thorarchaeota archaeon]